MWFLWFLKHTILCIACIHFGLYFYTSICTSIHIGVGKKHRRPSFPYCHRFFPYFLSSSFNFYHQCEIMPAFQHLYVFNIQYWYKLLKDQHFIYAFEQSLNSFKGPMFKKHLYEFSQRSIVWSNIFTKHHFPPSNVKPFSMSTCPLFSPDLDLIAEWATRIKSPDLVRQARSKQI